MLPSFNEVTWGRYPQGTGRITKHADPSEYGGVVAIFTLQGAATFRVLQRRSQGGRVGDLAR